MRLTPLLLLAVPALLGGQPARQVTTPPPATAFSAERLQRVDAYLQQLVDSQRIAGAVGLVLRDGVVVYERAVGSADREHGRPMATNALFRIASQTKALTSIAAMMLFEEGKLGLGDPVSRFIPAYAKTTVMVDGDRVPAGRQITIRDLLTQTAGISYGVEPTLGPLYREQGLGAAAGFGWYMADKDEPVCTTMERLATLPFLRQPGEAWVYGYASDILGCVVERASGMSLDAFFRTRITEPLQMTDTYFYVPVAERDRLVTLYGSDSTARLVRAPEGARGQGHYVDGPRRSFSGGAGLVSTARDYSRLLQMLLNGGTLEGVRLLAPQTVSLMTTNQTGNLYSTDGLGFGLGFYIIERLGADNTLLPVGSYGWGGAYASLYRVDPSQGVVIVLMLNQLPNQSDVVTKFPVLVYQALTTIRE